MSKPLRTLRKGWEPWAIVADQIATTPAGCWEFTGPRANYGYGKVGFADGMRAAHRISWEHHNGPIPVGMLVLHRCDNPPCVNPEHLWIGTQADNMRDMVAKGRGRGQFARH